MNDQIKAYQQMIEKQGIALGRIEYLVTECPYENARDLCEIIKKIIRQVNTDERIERYLEEKKRQEGDAPDEGM